MSATRRVLDRLSDVKETKGGWQARCPAHEDRKASLSIAEGDEGRVLLNCHAGCDHKSIVSALGLEESDLFDRDDQRPTAKASKAKKAGKAYETAKAAAAAYQRTLGKPTDVYEYEVAGEVVGLVVRWSRPDGTKEIRPVSLHADGWRMEHMPTPRPLYRLPALSASTGDRVYVVEGEKCVEAASGLGLLATTSPGGGKAAGKANWSPLAGREVVILPDADAAGRQYADEVAEILLRLDPPAVVRIVDLAPDADDGSDVADLAEPARCLGEPVGELIERLVAATEPLQQPAAAAATTSTPATPKATSTSSPVEAWRPFPTRAMPKAVSTLIEEAARAIGCDEAFVALPLLATLGSAIGTTRRVELKPGWRVLPIVWPVTVAESGSAKSPAADVSLDHVREREDRLHEEYLATLSTYEVEVEDYEKCRSAWRHDKKSDQPPPTRPRPPVQRSVLAEDATIEALVSALADNPRGLLVATDEFSGLLGSMGRYNGTPAADESLYLKAYGGRSHNQRRRTGRSVHIRQAAVWLTGTIQPGVLRRAIGVERRESGLLARLLLAQPPRRPKKWTTATVGWTTRGDFVRVLDNLYGLQHELVAGREESRIVRLSRDAETLFVPFFDEHNLETIQHSGDLAAAWSKLEEIAGRLALILHETRLAAGEHVVADEIDAASMAAAIELVAWFKYETRRVYSILGQTDEEAAERQADDRLSAWIDRHGGTTTARDLISACRWIATSDEAEAGLRRLVAAGRGDWRDRPPSERGGRPTRDFVLRRQPAVEARDPLEPKVASAKPREEAAKRGLGFADTDAGAQGGEEAVEI